MALKFNIGELLVQEDRISDEQLKIAKKQQRSTGEKLTAILVKNGAMSEFELTSFIGSQLGLATIDLDNFDIETKALNMVPVNFCKNNILIPIQHAGRHLVAAFSDPTNIYAKNDLEHLTRCKIDVVVASERAIFAAIEKYYESGSSLENIAHDLEDAEDAYGDVYQNLVRLRGTDSSPDDPIVKFVNVVLEEALKERASDIHIEQYKNKFRVRFRIDGILHEKTMPPPGTAAAIISRIKLLSQLDISEKRRPQDGHLKIQTNKHGDVDFRVSTLPTKFGEKTVLRNLSNEKLYVQLDELGFEEDDLKKFKVVLAQPQGMILITGPTGGGKTTTIYSSLFELNTSEVNICTAEDPIEVSIDGINQMQIEPKIELGFADALKSFLRQDPDIIMVGEIRDYDTASVAYKAASTGHMVLSTLHTNDCAATVSRLVDMGIPAYIVSESTSLIISQRLLRTICHKCKIKHDVSSEVLLESGVDKGELHKYKEIFKGKGCERCNHTGLYGREAVFEVMEISSAIKKSIQLGKSSREIKYYAIKYDKFRTLRQNALLKVQRGIVNLDQVLLNTMKDPIIKKKSK